MKGDYTYDDIPLEDTRPYYVPIQHKKFKVQNTIGHVTNFTPNHSKCCLLKDRSMCSEVDYGLGYECSEYIKKECNDSLDKLSPQCLFRVFMDPESFSDKLLQGCLKNHKDNKLCQLYISACRNKGVPIPSLEGNGCKDIPVSVLEESKKKGIPYYCWYAPCTLTPYYVLERKEIEERESCLNVSCSINVAELKEEKSQMNILCNPINNQSSSTYEIERMNSKFPLPSLWYLIFILICLYFIFLI